MSVREINLKTGETTVREYTKKELDSLVIRQQQEAQEEQIKLLNLKKQLAKEALLEKMLQDNLNNLSAPQEVKDYNALLDAK